MKLLLCLFALALALTLGPFVPAQTLAAQELSTARPSKGVERWNNEIQEQMLAQDFRKALALCLDAQREHPKQQVFRDLEASIREYLQAEQHGDDDEQLEAVYEQESQELTLRERLVQSATQDPLLSAHLGLGLHRATSLGEMTVLNPYSEANIALYFNPSLGVNLFYFDSHWNLVFEHTPGSDVQTTLYSLAFGGSLRFRNKFDDFSNRSALSFTFDIGVGLLDFFPTLSEAEFKPVLVFGFAFSDRPFYHIWGIEVLAGLQIDLGLSLFLNLGSASEISSVVQTGNWEAKIWQSFGVFRVGLSYRGSISEFYDFQQVGYIQHQFAFLLGLEWRTKFR